MRNLPTDARYAGLHQPTPAHEPGSDPEEDDSDGDLHREERPERGAGHDEERDHDYRHRLLEHLGDGDLEDPQLDRQGQHQGRLRVDHHEADPGECRPDHERAVVAGRDREDDGGDDADRGQHEAEPDQVLEQLPARLAPGSQRELPCPDGSQAASVIPLTIAISESTVT